MRLLGVGCCIAHWMRWHVHDKQNGVRRQTRPSQNSLVVPRIQIDTDKDFIMCLLTLGGRLRLLCFLQIFKTILWSSFFGDKERVVHKRRTCWTGRFSWKFFGTIIIEDYGDLTQDFSPRPLHFSKSTPPHGICTLFGDFGRVPVCFDAAKWQMARSTIIESLTGVQQVSPSAHDWYVFCHWSYSWFVGCSFQDWLRLASFHTSILVFVFPYRVLMSRLMSILCSVHSLGAQTAGWYVCEIIRHGHFLGSRWHQASGPAFGQRKLRVRSDGEAGFSNQY